MSTIESKRQWILREDGQDYDTVEAATMAEALAVARANVSRSNYPVDEDDERRTIWIRVEVRCEATDEEDADTVALPPREPRCDAGGPHDWQSPHEIVGGLQENPGVRGHGGGVIISQVCMRCGCGKHTDTWAQDPATGEQGLRSVTYRRREYEV